jgi:signal transduction histidine kinase
MGHLTAVGTGPRVRGRAEVAEMLAALRDAGEGPEELAHDARNMVTALELYCDLLEEAGVLSAGFHHYASELRLVAAASRRLVEKLSVFDLPQALRGAGASHLRGQLPGQFPGELPGQLPVITHPDGAAFDRMGRSPFRDQAAAQPIEDLATELKAKRNLFAAMAGPAIKVTQNIHGGALPVGLTREDLVRILMNLVKNAVEAMPAGGQIALGLDEFPAAGGRFRLVLTVEDSGPGIPNGKLEEIFAAGFTTRSIGMIGGGQLRPRGLGLHISRSIVEAARGRIFAANRPCGGARFEIELPVRTR